MAETADSENSAQTKTHLICVICHEPPDERSVASIDGCSHQFCYECINRWAAIKNACPLCKAAFRTVTSFDGATAEVSGNRTMDPASTMLHQIEELLRNVERTVTAFDGASTEVGGDGTAGATSAWNLEEALRNVDEHLEELRLEQERMLEEMQRNQQGILRSLRGMREQMMAGRDRTELD